MSCRLRAGLAVAAAASAVAGAVAAPAPAAPLPPSMQLLLTRGLSACATSRGCTAYVRAWAAACEADPRCAPALAQLLADNPSLLPTWTAIVGVRPPDPCAGGCL